MQTRSLSCGVTRQAAGMLLSAIAISLVLGSCAPAPTAPAQSGTLGTYVDDSPAWSRDGQWIAFHRRFRSSLGPPGVYVVSRWGGAPRLLVASDFLWPANMRFSPDGSKIACQWGHDVAFIDVASGDLTFPIGTLRPTSDPDWSPDGTRLLYVKQTEGSATPVDPESLGVHLLDLRTGVDRALRRDGNVILGSRPRWSPQGDVIAYKSYGPGGNGFRIQTIRPDGSGYRELAGADMGISADYSQWLASGGATQEGILFNFTGNPSSTQLARADGSGYTRWPVTLKPWDAVSHDGQFIARVMPGQTDGLWVIHVGRTWDFLGSSYYALTSYAPPATLAPPTPASP